MTEPQNPEMQTCSDPATQEMRIFCNSQLDDYFVGVKGELGQVERLVDDSVYKPHRSYEGVAKAVTAANAVSREKPVGQQGWVRAISICSRPAGCNTPIKQND